MIGYKAYSSKIFIKEPLYGAQILGGASAPKPYGFRCLWYVCWGEFSTAGREEGREKEEEENKLEVLSYQETHSDDATYVRNKLQ